MLRTGSTFDEVRNSFVWNVPVHYNIGVDVCDRWAAVEPDRLAIIDVTPGKSAREYTFADLKAMSNRLANALGARGLGRSPGAFGDRICVLLPQRVETAIAHLA